MRKLLESFGLITDPVCISESTRDSDKVSVWRDSVSGIIWNEGYGESVNGLEYWGSKTLAEARYKTLLDDMRRAQQFKKYLKDKTVLDFGCGHGGFIKQSENITKLIMGIDLFKIANDIMGWVEGNVDTITMFHVFEHLYDPIGYLEAMNVRLAKNGHLIIEVPHARDFLLNFLNCEPFKRHTLWSEHRVLHTRESLQMFLEKAGYKNIKIEGYQRYGLNNHLHWLSQGKPGGMDCWDFLKNDEYIKMLQKMDATDTLIAIAEA